MTKRPHPGHDKEYLAWLAARKAHVAGCEVVGYGVCTCFDWGYEQFFKETVTIKEMG